MINGQNHVAARHADLRVPLPTPNSTNSAQSKGSNSRGKFRAFLKRMFGRRLDG